MRKIFKYLVIMSLFVGLFYLYNKNQISSFKSQNIRIYSNKINNSIKITQISDFHSNYHINLQDLINEIEDFDPDFIALTGDMIDRKDENLEITLNLFKALSKLNKEIYFIYGNHEVGHMLYDKYTKEINDIGINILDNDYVTIKVDDENINIIGFKYAYFEYENLAQYERIQGDINLEYYNLLLIHSPDNVETLLNGSEDLILSGHTHGGQIRLPLIGPIVAPGQGFFPKYDKGIFKIDNSTLYIDSGLGNSLAPLRAFNPVQISNITIEATK